MKVLTLNERSFLEACLALSRTIRESFDPDLVIGIATGGEYVAACIFPELPHVSIALRRPSTADKERASIVFRILRRSPRWIADALRIAEARILALKAKGYRRRAVVLTPDVRRAVESARRVLVVDDAVDSGSTLRDILDAIAAVPGTREVRTAVLTVTTASPLLLPDFYLYHNSTLIRFPWSKDYWSL